MAACFGLYFGSSNVSIAMHKEGKNDVLTNDAGDRVTPAMVAFINGEKCVGLAAKQNKIRFASSTISHIKEAIQDPQAYEKSHKQFKVHCKDDSVQFEIKDGDATGRHSLASLVLSIFKHMHDIAKRCCQESACSFPSVLTVPNTFSQEQKQFLRDCAAKSGFDILRVISEPSAAALAYNVGQDKNTGCSNVVVHRVGGKSMDVTVLEVMNGVYYIRSHVTVPEIGGDTFTHCIVEHCLQEFQRLYKADVSNNQRAIGKLHNAADICKIGLSLNSTSQCCAESLYDGIDLSINVSRARFEALISNALQQCIDPINQALQKAGLQQQDISQVVLCGGSAQVSRLQQLLKDFFVSAQVLTQIPPDEVIARGAAEQAAILLSREKNDVREIETIAKTLYIKGQKEDKPFLVAVLLEGCPIPAKWQHTLKLPADQTSFVLDIMEGEKGETCPDKAVALGKLIMKNLPQNSNISVSLQMKSDGSLYVCCSETSSNQAESLVIDSDR